MNLECMHCYKPYYYAESTAITQSMYCTKECEDAEVQRLKDGNSILEQAQKENPQAFTASQVAVIPKHPEGILRMLNFNKAPIKEESTED